LFATLNLPLPETTSTPADPAQSLEALIHDDMRTPAMKAVDDAREESSKKRKEAMIQRKRKMKEAEDIVNNKKEKLSSQDE
jgi:hypothetical protein